MKKKNKRDGLHVLCLHVNKVLDLYTHDIHVNQKKKTVWQRIVEVQYVYICMEKKIDWIVWKRKKKKKKKKNYCMEWIVWMYHLYGKEKRKRKKKKTKTKGTATRCALSACACVKLGACTVVCTGSCTVIDVVCGAVIIWQCG